MTTIAYLYRWTDMTTGMWYIGSRSAIGCHPQDGYLCSSNIVKPLILENRDNWKRDVLVLSNPEYITNLETKYLQLLDAKNDPMSYNKHNGDGIYVSFGNKNSMKNPITAKKVADSIRGENHWTHNLGNKEHPQKGQKRPTITGENHPNKRKENAIKISKSHLGKKHEYALGDNNVMKNPEIAAKISGKNHWTSKHETQQCVHCGVVCSKNNYTRWHGDKCKRNTK